MASVEKRGKSYRIVVSNGIDHNGNQIKEYYKYTPSENLTQRQIDKELEKLKVQYEEETKNGNANLGKIKFADFCNVFIEKYAKKNLKLSTLTGYLNCISVVNNAIGHIRLKDLRTKHFNDLYSNLAEEGVFSKYSYTPTDYLISRIEDYKKNKGSYMKLAEASGIGTSTLKAIRDKENVEKPQAEKLCNALNLEFSDCFKRHTIRTTISNNSICHFHRHITSILNKAVQWGYIEKNPSVYAIKPKMEHKRKSLPDIDEVMRLTNCLEDEPIKYKTMILLLIYSGMRKGELLGLEWEDINFEKETVNIERASQYVEHIGIITVTTKNQSSERVIKLPKIIFDLLRTYRVWQSEEIIALGDKWNREWQESKRLFTTWDGKPMHPDSLNKWFTDFLKRNDLQHMTIHELRHLNASLMIMQNNPITIVSRRLGHSRPSTTMSIYAHALKSADAEASESIADILQAK